MIGSLADVQSLSNLGRSLDTIYLEYNPLQEDPLYRKKLHELIPSLSQIDANLIGGLASNGIRPPIASHGVAETEEEQLRRLQNMVVERAQAESQRQQGS